MAVTAGDDGIVQDQQVRKIVFFDVETTVPIRTGQKYELLEFGAIVLDFEGLSEVHSYETLIRPKDLNSINHRSLECNGISKESAAEAPTFTEVADEIYGILNGRIWAGHNIEKFDMLRISEAFSEAARQAPEPAGIIDTYPLLKRTFGRRAGNLKLATLANYCGYGIQKHRSLDDVRMNLDVLRSCATMMFLELNYPNIFTAERELSAWTSTIKHLATPTISQEQIRRSRNDFLPEQDGLPSKLTESVQMEISGSIGTGQLPREHISGPHVSSQIEQDGPSEVSESITENALAIEPSCAQLSSKAMVKEGTSSCEMSYTSSPSPSSNDPNKAGNVVRSDLEALNGVTCQGDTQKVYKLFIMMGLANIEIASLEEPKTVYSEVAGSSVSEHDRPPKDDTLLVGNETEVFNTSTAEPEVGVEENCDLSAALLSLPVSDMEDADALDISGIEAHNSSSTVQMSDSDLRITAGVARESFLLSNCVSLDLIELVDEKSQFGYKKALYHRGIPLRLWECETRVRFTINSTYAFDDKGKPRFSILIEGSERACEVICKCEELAKSNMAAYGEKATWFTILRNDRGARGVRMSIGTKGIGCFATYTTKFYQLTSSGVREIVLCKVDAAEFRYLLPHGSVVDVGFRFGVFNINNRAGIKLVAEYITIR